MQSSEVISVNFWQIIISILNLLILYVILKKLLFKPVSNMISQRQSKIDNDLAGAKRAKQEAENEKRVYEEKLSAADDEAAQILKDAKQRAERKSDKIVNDAKNKADGILRQAQADASLEFQKAQSDIHREITEVSALLSEKILEREINADDHRRFIDSFIENLGEGYDGHE
ncbi:MAG: F0F1 ATP synthase subunit B [Clostridia bacterium]|nr:F0F1 ATP synthase subunit B [Clostridia bacterium]